MPLQVYRVCRAKYARLDGEGAKRAGGRWNSPGYAVVYMAESISLAVLENLVHMSKVDFPSGYVALTALIPDSVAMLDGNEFRAGGRSCPEAGDRWIESRKSAVLRVQSAVVRSEHLYLLNPAHHDFDRVQVEQIEPFAFDPRLF